MRIRPEAPEDRAEVYEVERLAFGQENEARLVEALRSEDPFLSLVALDEGRVVGHILFTPIVIEGGPAGGSVPALALAPMAVLPSRQRRGIGSALVRAGLERCRAEGHRIVIVLGHPEYYPRFGFGPARAFGIESPFPAPDAAWLALELVPGSLAGVRGTVRYPAPFADV